MADQFDQELEKVITRIHTFLSTNFTLPSDSRDLNAEENSILVELDRASSKYRQLAGALAVESYIHYVVQLLSGCEPLLEITALLFSNMSEARSWALQTESQQLGQLLEESWLNLGKLAQITHKIFPRSPMVTIHRDFLSEAGSDPSETIYGRLYEQNQELKIKLDQNDKHLIDLELRLTRLLQEHDGCEGTVDSSLKFLEMREQIVLKDEEIERMNEQFSVQIQKYNTVYEAMKREIEDLKDFRDADMVQVVEGLQTQIVKLRQERERDELIIRQLKDRNYYSPPNRKPTTYSRVYY